jgi:hypothetical protein
MVVAAVMIIKNLKYCLCGKKKNAEHHEIIPKTFQNIRKHSFPLRFIMGPGPQYLAIATLPTPVTIVVSVAVKKLVAESVRFCKITRPARSARYQFSHMYI